MDTNLLREWLQLPNGPWPPEMRTLLGLPSQYVTLHDAEQNALSRMELLRPHQLRHPELVTEGMNRLAQALLQFTALPTDASEAPPTIVLDAEVIEEVVMIAKASKQRSQRTPRPRNALRESYRDLARYRRVRRAWYDLKLILAAPSERIVTAEMIARLSIARNALLRHRSERLDAFAVWKLMKGAHAVQRIRSLSHEERQHLAADWDACRVELESEYDADRKAISLRRPRSNTVRRIRDFSDCVRANPEWILAALTIATLLLGLIRN